MASYKVPQDVEADDKLIGPFSFRQFIYLIAMTLGIAMAYFLSKVFIGLILIPMPFIIFFGALALPLRKDQPMEIYLVAVLRFFFKPRIRYWRPEGQVNLVTIVAPRVEEVRLTKDYGAEEAQQRLAYLADVIDTQGWAARGVSSTAMASLNDTVTAEASTIDDVMDGGVGRQFESLIEQQDAIRKQQLSQQFQAAMSAPQPTEPTQTASLPPAQYTAVPEPSVATQPTPQPLDTAYSMPAPVVAADFVAPAPTFNPYPDAIRQHVIHPGGSQPAAEPNPVPTPPTSQPAENASDKAPSPDIMRLASNNDLSISAIAREAHRLQDNEEVVISLH